MRLILTCLVSVMFVASASAQLVKGESTIRAKAGPTDIVITTTSRLAGAIHSLTWHGKEFIDSVDHGRQLQSACSFDLAQPGEFWAECYNPTEAGSARDGAGAKTTSRLLYLKADGRTLHTVTQPAFWLVPGEKSQGRPAKNTKILSEHLIAKQVTIGMKESAHAIDYRVTFTVPPGEKHNLAQFEALTGYMPPEFSKFLTCDPKTGQLTDLTDGPGEQRYPVILSTPNGSHAMGIYSPDAGASYGRFRFVPEKVVKWNCVFRVRDKEGIAPGEYRYRCIVAVGSLQNVVDTLKAVANGK
ncbi:MAG: hypothetical protein ACRC8S_06470 [Fimbriiglobus sp.]